MMKPNNTLQLAIKDEILENKLSEEAKNQFNKIKEKEKTANRENLVYRTNEYTLSFKNFQSINTFGRDIYNDKITLKEANEDQHSLLAENLNFRIEIKTKKPVNKRKNEDTLKSLYALFEGSKRFLDAFESGIFPINEIEGTDFSDFNHSNLKILNCKQMLQILLMALAQVRAGNTSENLLNKIRQIVYSS